MNDCTCAHCRPARLAKAVINTLAIEDDIGNKKLTIDELIEELQKEITLLKGRYNKMKTEYNNVLQRLAIVEKMNTKKWI